MENSVTGNLDVIHQNKNNFKLDKPLLYMAEKEDDYAGQEFMGINTKIRDLEEKQRMLKDRLVLIGENLLEMKEKNNEDMIEIKKDLERIHQVLERLKSFIETASAEFPKFAKKEDVEILAKQAKMFKPLELIKRNKKKT